MGEVQDIVDGKSIGLHSAKMFSVLSRAGGKAKQGNGGGGSVMKGEWPNFFTLVGMNDC